MACLFDIEIARFYAHVGAEQLDPLAFPVILLEHTTADTCSASLVYVLCSLLHYGIRDTVGRMVTMTTAVGSQKMGRAWIALCIAFVLHVVDEASTGFLAVYNPTVIALRERFPSFPMPVFEFNSWLAGLIIVNVLLLLLSPLVFRGVRWMRPVAYVFAVIMLANGLGHTLGTIVGRTVASVRFPRPMPGFYSSPLLIAASIFLLYRLRKSRSIQRP